MTPPILIIDCHAIGHAAKHTYGALSHDGSPTGVIYGFLIKILTLARDFKTNKFVFAWDSGKSFRRGIYPEYKNKDIEYSAEEVEELRHAKHQFADLRIDVLPRLGFKNIFIQTGLEADDIIASVVMNNEGNKIVVSDDRDLYQLLDYCNIFKIKKKVIYTKESLNKSWGCTPDEWREMKLYAGCTGDNVPNIPRVKEKTAIKYIKGTASAKITCEISRVVSSESEFIERNRKLTSLPFEGTEIIKLNDFPPLKFNEIYRVCSDLGFNSLLFKKNYQHIWQFLCEEEV